MIRIYTECRVDSTIQIKHLEKEKAHSPNQIDYEQKGEEAVFIRWQDFCPGLMSFASDFLEEFSHEKEKKGMLGAGLVAGMDIIKKKIKKDQNE